MKKRKLMALLVSLVMVLGIIPSVTEADETTETPTETPAETTILDEGLHFVDIAHKGNTLVAMAKKADNSGGKLYYSADGGNTWQPTNNQPGGLVGSAVISGNQLSQQQLVYWAAKNIFVAHGAGATYQSADGATWSAADALHWTTNTMLTTSGDMLVFGGQDSTNATNDLTTKQFAANKHSLGTSGFYTLVTAAKPADENGVTELFVANRYQVFDVSFTVDGTKCTWTDVKSGSGNIGNAALYDAVYSPRTNQYLAVDGTEKLQVFTDAQSRPQLTIFAGDKVTGVNANENGVVVGMDSGKMYYNNSDQTLNSSNNTWTEILVNDGKTAAKEPIKNIEFLDDGSFVALGTTQIYKGTINGYQNINENDAPEETPTPTPAPSDEPLETPSVNPDGIFADVTLIGGVHHNGTYIVYGNDSTPAEDADDKRLGKIFTSTDDGVTWEKTADNVTTFSTQKNGAVWWKDKFVISGASDMVPQSNGGTVGLAMVSPDGSADSWEMVTQTDFRVKTDLVVRDDKIYTTNHGRQFRALTDLAYDSSMLVTALTASTHLPEAQAYYETVAMSNSAGTDGGYSVFLAYMGFGMVRNSESQAAEEADKWTKIGNVGGAGSVTDAVYSEALGKFVVTLNGGLRTSIVSTTGGNGVQGPVVSGQVCEALDTNGTDFMFACDNGGVYTAADNASFYVSPEEKAVLTKVAAANGKENTLPVKNVCVAGDKFLAVATDGTNSDVLIISKSTGGEYSYVRASDSEENPEETPAPSGDPEETPAPSGDPDKTPIPEIKFSIEYSKGESGEDTAAVTAPNGTYTVIFAAYGADDALISVDVQDVTVTDGKATVSADKSKFKTDGAASGKVMLWDSIRGMKPLAMTPIPFV